MSPRALNAFTYARALMGHVALIGATAALSPVAMFAGGLGYRALADRICLAWGGLLLRLYGIDVRLAGIENFPPGTAGLLLFNHQSLFDIPVLYGTLRRTVRFGAKIELFKVPLFGQAMRAMGTLPIARANRAETMETYRHAEAMFAKGFSYALAPEGTRQDEPAIGRFKAGPFIFAIGAQAPIIPAVIKGAHEVLPKNRLMPNIGARRRTVDLLLLPPIPTRGLGVEDVGPLMERVRSAMVDAYARLPDARC
jgi:1-acyl-sn-glycerol-3-phosphate acyltransferase